MQVQGMYPSSFNFYFRKILLIYIEAKCILYNIHKKSGDNIMQDNKDNNNVNDIDNKNADNSTDTSTTEKKDEYEKVCYVCHRTESRAGKMINMGNNIYICPDCMQRSFDAIYNSGINYDDMMKNIPGMGNIPGMNGFMSGDMNDNISQKQKIKKKNNKDDKDKKEDMI